jgi:hypothetical protein
MSRSRRRIPIFGNTTAPSEAADKALWSRRRRRVVRCRIQAGRDDILDPVVEVYDGAKDGKRFVGHRPQFNPDRMRK